MSIQESLKITEAAEVRPTFIGAINSELTFKVPDRHDAIAASAMPVECGNCNCFYAFSAVTGLANTLRKDAIKIPGDTSIINIDDINIAYHLTVMGKFIDDIYNNNEKPICKRGMPVCGLESGANDSLSLAGIQKETKVDLPKKHKARSWIHR